jgi:predicted ATPase/Tfp pilus assembly protein PilF/DNA-binding XRE family transcriptional regulator
MPDEPAAEPSFAALLRRYRRAAGLTQEQLAERAGLSGRAVSDLERDDERVPRRDTRDLLVTALQLSPAEQAVLERAATRARAQSPEPALATPSPLGPYLTPLLAQPTAFIGREREILAVRDRLADPDTHLLTLLGPGGMGKTRLAMEVAAAVRDRFVDGIAFVPLAPLVDPALVLPTAAQALGVSEVPGQTLLQTLAAFLHGKRLLLVFDNFEQVSEAAAELADLLGQALSVAALVTSRSALRTRGERVHQVGPLGVPRPPLPALAALSQYEAVRLFIARAQDAQPDFAVTNETAPAVAEICARLDGLPLAIELVAARSRLLEPEALLARLGERLRVATGGARDLPARQQTLRAAIDWSYDLLEPAEQRLFARLAVFAGGRTLAAIEAVCDQDDDLGVEVLNGVESLLDKSLLRRELGADGEQRLVLLETIHEYARERLAASGEQAVLEAVHARYYLALAETAEPHLNGAQQGHWLAVLETEHDNLRAVLRWAIARGEPEVGLRVAATVARFWEVRGYLTEGRGWLQTLLARPEEQPPSLTARAARAKALLGAGTITQRQGDPGRATALLEESLAQCRESGDKHGVARALHGLGIVATSRGNLAQAEALYTEVLDLGRALGDQHSVARALYNLGRMAMGRGDPERAEALLEESLALCRELSDTAGAARALYGLGGVAYGRGDLARAKVLHEKNLDLNRELGAKYGIASALTVLGLVADDQGDFARARALHEESLDLFRELGDTECIAIVLSNLGWGVIAEQGELAQARALLEESIALCRALDNKQGLAYALANLGRVDELQGELEQARVFLEESLVLFRGLGHKQGVGYALGNLGRVATIQGDSERARGLLEESLTLSLESGSTEDMLENLVRIADPATGLVGPARLMRAATLLGTVTALRDAIGMPLPPSNKADYERTVNAVRSALGESAWAASWAEGQLLTLEQAVNLALGAPPTS